MHRKICWLVTLAVGNLGLGCDDDSSAGSSHYLTDSQGIPVLPRSLAYGVDGGAMAPDPDNGQASNHAARDAGWEEGATAVVDGAPLIDEPGELEKGEPSVDGGVGPTDCGPNNDAHCSIEYDAKPEVDGGSEKPVCDCDSNGLCDDKGNCWLTHCFDPEFIIQMETDGYWKEVDASDDILWVGIELEQDIWLDLVPYYGRWIHRGKPEIEAGTKVRLHGGKAANGHLWSGATDWFDWVTGEYLPVESPCEDCVPATCDELEVECGEVVDNCGHTLVCDACAGGFSCESNRCQLDDCYDPEFWMIGYPDQWWVEFSSATASVVELEQQGQPENLLPLESRHYENRWVYRVGDETDLPEVPAGTLVRLHATGQPPEQVAISEWFAWPDGPTPEPFEDISIAVECLEGALR